MFSASTPIPSACVRGADEGAEERAGRGASLATLKHTRFAYFLNVIFMIKILYSDYHGSSTLSCFVSFVLLVLMKLYNSFIVARESIHNDKMMSAYMSEFVSFNVLDADYITDKECDDTKDIILEEEKLKP